MPPEAHRGAARGYVITPSATEPPMIFADHAAAGRSGHLGHAMFQSADGTLYGFFSNCTGEHNDGHSAVGWMEYRTSRDYGDTWSQAQVFSLSKSVFDAGTGDALFCEKAVVTRSGAVVLFCLVSDIERTPAWEPYRVPLAVRSLDGASRGEPAPVGSDRGRIYDAIHHDGAIYVLVFCNDATQDYCGVSADHVYRLYRSNDDGLTFNEISVLPFDTYGRCYGTMCRRPDGSLVVYVYDRADETMLDSLISEDGGKSWNQPPSKVKFTKRLRNPQIVSFAGRYFIHGRSGNGGAEAGHFVLYQSDDALTWDEGQFIAKRTHGIGAYSNNIVIEDKRTGRQRVRIHASHAYELNRTNVLAWWLDEASTGERREVRP